MKYYLVDVTWYNPYPKQYKYRTNGNDISTAVARGVKQFRKENKGRRIKEISLKIKEYGTSLPGLISSETLAVNS